MVLLGTALVLGCRHDAHFEATLQDASDIESQIPAAPTGPAKRAYVAVRGPRLPIESIRARVEDKAAALVFPVARSVVLEVVVQNGSEVSTDARLFRFRSNELSEFLNRPRKGWPESALNLGWGAAKDAGSMVQRSGLPNWSTMTALPSRLLPTNVRHDGRGDFWAMSPRTGTVHQLRLSPDSRISPRDGSPVLAIGDLNKLLVIADYHVTHIRGLRLGQKTLIRLPEHNRAVEGELQSIGEAVDAERQTVELRASTKNDQQLLRPGMRVTMDLHPIASADPVVLIPASAVTRRGRHGAVLVQDDAGSVSSRAVQLGHGTGGHVEILDGLTEGERVLVHEPS